MTRATQTPHAVSLSNRQPGSQGRPFDKLRACGQATVAVRDRTP